MPALFRTYFGLGRFGLPYDFSIVEELIATAVFLVVLLTFRGLYGQIPFLLSLALGVVFGYVSVITIRMATAPNVVLSALQLKRRGWFTRLGIAYVGVVAVAATLVAHSAFVRFHEYNGLRGVIAIENTAETGAPDALAASTYRHLQIADRWGLLSNVRTQRGMVIAAMQLKQYVDVVRIGEQYLQDNDDDRVRLLLGAALAEQGRLGEAKLQLRRIVDSPANATNQAGGIAASAYQTLGDILLRQGDFAGATDALQNAVRMDPSRAAVHAELGSTLAELGRFDEAIASLGEAVRLDAGDSRAIYNLATLLGIRGRFAEAVPHYERALTITPEDADLHNNCGFALFRLGRMEYARQHLERAIELNRNHADAHFNLGALLAASGQSQEAEGQLRIAASLDVRYGRLLSGQ
jgi:Flp pilus assembly protein TadD